MTFLTVWPGGYLLLRSKTTHLAGPEPAAGPALNIQLPDSLCIIHILQYKSMHQLAYLTNYGEDAFIYTLAIH